MTVSRRALRSVLAVGVLVAAVMSLIAVAIPAGAGAHAERATFFPDPNVGDFPQYRTTGPSWVVCKPDTRQRIQNMSADVRRYNEELLARCNFKSIQRAVNRARNGDRILVLPGTYREVFMLRLVEGLDTAETAAVLGLGEEAVKQRLHRARAMLRDGLFRRAGLTLDGVFTFGHSRCDRLVANVMERITTMS